MTLFYFQTRIVSQSPLFDWTCERKSTLEKVNRTIPISGSDGNISVSSSECPIRCYLHDNCRDCLQSKGAEGGWNGTTSFQLIRVKNMNYMITFFVVTLLQC